MTELDLLDRRHSQTCVWVHALNAYYYRQCGLDQTTLARSDAFLERALRGGQPLTRRELEGLLDKAGFAAHGVGLAYVLMHAELNGIETDVVTPLDDPVQGALQGAIERYAWFLNRPIRC